MSVQTIFRPLQETCLKNRMLLLCKRGFPLTISDVQGIAFHYATKLHRQKTLQRDISTTWFKSKKATYEWWLGFKRRHDDLTIRVAENISTARAEAINHERIQNFFRDFTEIFDNCGLHNFPQLVWNCDETGLSSVVDKGQKAVAKKGSRSVYKIQPGERGTLTTILPCGNAVGDLIPPVVIFKGQCVSS
jgi:hypothetical protein